ncbi:MAG: XrtA system polysaccharide deacetylase [Candidatus Binatia bacterium]
MTSVINALSIDVEDWFQVSDFEEAVRFSDWDWYEARVVRNTRRILSILEKNRVQATFFVLTWNAERFPDLIREIDRAGHEIGTHGYAHRLIYTQTKQEFRQDLLRSVGLLEDLTGKKVLGYRAPSFSITRDSLWALDILLEMGFRYDSSIFPLRDQLYGIPDSHRYPYVVRQNGSRSLVEFPMSTVRFLNHNLPLAGGAYLRIFPYRFFRWGIKRLNGEGHPAILYLHPWEIDPNHPRIAARGHRGYTSHYLNLRGTEKKLARLLRDFSFGSVRDVLALTLKEL